MTWFDTISKKKAKGLRKLEKALLAEGYKMIETGQGSRMESQGRTGGKHNKIKVMRLEEVNIPNAQVVEVPISSAVMDGKKNIKMVIREIKQKFSGRKGRGLGSFKLSNDKTNTWHSVLKIKIRDIEPKDNPLSDEFQAPVIPPNTISLFTENISERVNRELKNFSLIKDAFDIPPFNPDRSKTGLYFSKKLYIVTPITTITFKNNVERNNIKEFIEECRLFFDYIFEECRNVLRHSTYFLPTLKQDLKSFLTGIEYMLRGQTDKVSQLTSSQRHSNKLLEDILQDNLESYMEEEDIDEMSDDEIEAYYDRLLIGDEIDEDTEREALENGNEWWSEMVEEDYEELSTEERLRNRRNTNG